MKARAVLRICPRLRLLLILLGGGLAGTLLQAGPCGYYFDGYAEGEELGCGGYYAGECSWGGRAFCPRPWYTAAGYASPYDSFNPQLYFYRPSDLAIPGNSGSYGSRIYVVPSYGSGWGGSGRVVMQVFTMPDRTGDWEEDEKALGWRDLALGDYVRASYRFAAMERQLPGAAWPKVGTGLLAAFNGDYSRAHYQFRRAFRYDARGPGILPDDPALSVQLRRAADYYRQAAEASPRKADLEFMLAAVAYLAQDYETARVAIARAIKHGDDCRSARNLQTLVDEAALTSAYFASLPEQGSE